MSKPVLVLKIGSAAITNSAGEVDEQLISSLASQLALIHSKFRIVIVSSGAVATGKTFIKNYSGTISERKAAAAIGNPVLIRKYSTAFLPYEIAIAQSLCERQHFSERCRFIQLKDTFAELWKNGIIPIANENDVVSSLELKFSDNDELATLIAAGFDAHYLLIASTAGGLKDRSGKIIEEIPLIDDSVFGLADNSTSGSGLGGMVSKLTFARLATRMGIHTVIFGLKENCIQDALDGKTGTQFLPQKRSATARQKWLASGSLVSGNIQVDAGAVKALLARKSLLAVGITHVLGEFGKGEIVEILDENAASFAVARCRFSSEEIRLQPKLRDREIAHADDIVLL